MSILEALRQVESEIFDDKHPLVGEILELRESYAIGYTMLVCINGYPSEIAKKQLKKQIISLGLPPKFKKTAITTAINADPEIVHQILLMLADPKHKYIFMLDLYDFAIKDQKVTEQEQEFLLIFERLLQLSPHELHFVRGFRLAMLKKDAELASNVVQEALVNELPIPVKELHYFLNTFEYWKYEPQNEKETTTSVYRAKIEAN